MKLRSEFIIARLINEFGTSATLVMKIDEFDTVTKNLALIEVV